MPATWAADWSVGDVVTKTEFRKSLGCVADSTLGVAAASFDFTGLPTTYAHLMIVCQLRGDTVATTVDAYARFNGDTAANYDWQYVRASAAAVTAAESFASATTGLYLGSASAASATASVASVHMIDVPNYGGTTFNKATHTRTAIKLGTSTTNLNAFELGGFWRSTAAINRITVFPVSGNFAAGSRCSVYVMGS